MRFNFKKLALLGAWIIFTEGSAYPQDVIDKRQPLVEMSVWRLAIAEQAALAKWDSRTPVEDASREEHVVVSATKAGQVRGLDPTSMSNFLSAQIKANKLVQYSLFADWRRVGKAPDHAPVDLAGTIRPQLDDGSPVAFILTVATLLSFSHKPNVRNDPLSVGEAIVSGRLCAWRYSSISFLLLSVGW